NADDFAKALDRWADRRVLMLGEARHGTAQFYQARAAITRRMIETHGATIVAVEADWPDAAFANRYVRGLKAPKGEAPFQRFPRWMWRNAIMAELLDWMRDWNRDRPPEAQAGFYGLDMYNMNASMRAVLAYLDEVDPDAARIARKRYGCLQPWINRPDAYGRAVLSSGYKGCEDAVVSQCRDLMNRAQDESTTESDLLDATQNAKLVASAERYHRIMYRGGPAAWNLRDSHMCATLAHLLNTAGPQAKAVVWAHNSHIGDARRSEMNWARGEHSLGQLARQEWGDDVALIGFGTHAGTVTAARDWEARKEVMTIRPSHPDSFERLCHDSGVPRFLLDMAAKPVFAEALAPPRLQRFIGVIYRPESELPSHYMQTEASRQYDGWVWFDRTTALTAAGPKGRHVALPPTWPFGT
ncbi:MAG: erythromycin esterase family protein, partial [Alphaproteobacteria bacterium]|nr:erythromycin esterase family protein [Alphaproteobacteria bacterium]